MTSFDMETRCEVESDAFVFSHLKMPKPPATGLLSGLHACVSEYDPVLFFPGSKNDQQKKKIKKKRCP